MYCKVEIGIKLNSIFTGFDAKITINAQQISTLCKSYTALINTKSQHSMVVRAVVFQ